MSQCTHEIQVVTVFGGFRWKCACGQVQFVKSARREDALRLGVLHQRRECPDRAHAEEWRELRERAS